MLDLFEPQPASDPRLAGRAASFDAPRILAARTPARRRIWEFDSHLHCSIIGTCLSTAELRRILGKLGVSEAASATEHDLHRLGVLLAGKRNEGAKLLHKTLDRRHRVAIQRFIRAKGHRRDPRPLAGGGQERRDPRRLLGGVDAPGDKWRAAAGNL